MWECPNSYSNPESDDRKAVACSEGEYCKESEGAYCPGGSIIEAAFGEADKAGCSREELEAARDKVSELFADLLPEEEAHNICYQKKKELGTCTHIEIKGTCGGVTVIEATQTC